MLLISGNVVDGDPLLDSGPIGVADSPGNVETLLLVSGAVVDGKPLLVSGPTGVPDSPGKVTVLPPVKEYE
jgi:hypothetical protein